MPVQVIKLPRICNKQQDIAKALDPKSGLEMSGGHGCTETLNIAKR